MENLPRLGLAAVLAYGGWLAIDGQVGIGTLVAFNAYVVMLQTPFRHARVLPDADPAGRGVGRAASTRSSTRPRPSSTDRAPST